jgi:hypothetical protein
MTQQVLYDVTSAQVLQWQDTEKYSYATPPATMNTLEVTAAEWANQSGTWYVVNGALTQTNPNAPTAAQLLAKAQKSQLTTLTAAYQTAIVQPVSYTSKGGVTKTYQADPGSLSNLQNTLLGLQAAGATPSGFYWVSADNTQVPFTYADLQGLAAAMLAQGWAAFQKLQTLKAEVNAATSVSAVQAVVWS